MKDECRLLIKTIVFIEHCNIKKIPVHALYNMWKTFSLLYRPSTDYPVFRDASYDSFGPLSCATALSNTHLVNLPIEPYIGYPVGSVTKKWFSCQENLPFEEEVSYCLSWLSVFGRALVEIKTPFSNPPVLCGTLCVDHQTLDDWSQLCCKSMSNFILSNFLLLFLWWLRGWREVRGKFVEVDDSCFSKQKCNCGRLCVTAWVFVDVEWELRTPVLHLSLIALPRHSSPSLRHVSYPAPQSSVTTVVTMFVSSMKDSHTMPSIAPSFLCPTDAHTNTVKATWRHINIHLRPYLENEVKRVIDRLRGSESAKFDDDPE